MIGVLGANGFIGSSLLKNGVISITRDNYKYIKDKNFTFDIFINAAGNNLSYWANQFPNEDFIKSVNPVYNSIFDFNIKKYIYISSIATYDDNSSYGFNKIISEEIIKKHCKDYLILRCCNVIDVSSSAGVIFDIKNNIPLFITKDSKIQFITRKGLADVIYKLIDLNITNKVINVGGLGSVSAAEIEEILGKKINIKQDAKYRKYEMDVSELDSIISMKTSKEYVMDIL